MRSNKVIICTLIILLFTSYRSIVADCKSSSVVPSNMNLAVQKEVITLVKLYDRDVIVNIGGDEVRIPFCGIGITMDLKKAIGYHLLSKGIDKELVPLKNIWKIKHPIYKLKQGIEYTLIYDKEVIQDNIKDYLSNYNKKAKNASIKYENKAFHLIEEIEGRSVNLTDIMGKLQSSLENWDGRDIKIKAGLLMIKPKITMDKLKKIDHRISSFETKFTSSTARVNNLTNGAKFLNGVVVMPGEVFSAYEVLAPFTIENGYDSSSTFTSNDIVDSIGGGVCQITTTLYNAVLLTELEVIERYHHVFYVSYVDLGRDAAISTKYKDFKFKNTMESPIYISCFVEKNTLVVELFGCKDELNTNISYEFITEEKLSIAPGEDIIIRDDSKPSNYYRVEQEYRYGYEVVLDRITYLNGVEIKKEKVNKSRYKALQRKVVVGVP